MSKRSKEKTRSRLADWEVTTDAGEHNPPRVEDLQQSWWDRSKRGWYTFRDTKGVVAEFAPGTVLKVRRKEAAEAPAEKALAAVAAQTVLAAKRQNGER